jgi:hypothetical protein
LIVDLRLFIPGDYEDVFAYMGQLVAVGNDRALLTLDFDELVESLVPADVWQLARLLLLRNDLLLSDGVRTLLADKTIASVLHRKLAGNGAFFVDPSSWNASTVYESLLGPAAVLDLQIYAQRLFVGTTSGLIQADLVQDDGELRFSQPVKRTDDRCLAVNIRYGTVAASCGSTGLMVSFDEFGQLREARRREALESCAPVSQRTAWLGYNLINYSTAVTAEALRAKYETTWRRSENRREVVLTEFRRDETLLSSERTAWKDADFVYNDQATFFVHRADDTYEARRRTWRNGRLSTVVSTDRGVIARPLSAHSSAAGLVLETYDAVWLYGPNGLSRLYEGEAIVVRTFPASIRYKNLIAVVDNDGLHIISPIAVEPGNAHNSTA